MTLTVLVPSEEGQTALARLEWAEAVRYTPGEPWPERGSSAEVLVVPAPCADPGQLLAAMPELPKLRMVQTLSAGTEEWEGRLTGGVLLSNARGANGGGPRPLAPGRVAAGG